ncbi:MAG: hypothetical protein PHS93_08795 [Candidatus Omnitrophica bacterium]|nr:hypothetical protein [Candidatus Omnitrophota bacterium]MDD5551154.1 hypothetical protein [Candidatus Omnitrophota bacterium]
MPKFLDADLVLSKLRNDEVVLIDETHLISFDEKISDSDLEELEKRCAALGYTFDNVGVYKNKDGAFFAYNMKRSK